MATSFFSNFTCFSNFTFFRHFTFKNPQGNVHVFTIGESEQNVNKLYKIMEKHNNKQKDKSIRFVDWLADHVYKIDYYLESELENVKKFNNIFLEYDYPNPAVFEYDPEVDTYSLSYVFTKPIPKELVDAYLNKVKLFISNEDTYTEADKLCALNDIKVQYLEYLN